MKEINFSICSLKGDDRSSDSQIGPDYFVFIFFYGEVLKFSNILQKFIHRINAL